MKRKQTMRSFVYLTIGLAMLFYAMPNLPHVEASLKGAFTVSWLMLAMLIIGANLFHLIGVDRESQARKKRYAWLRSGMREIRRGYFVEAKRQIKQDAGNNNKRRYMN
ncbi:MAG: hypothetical protein WCC10_10095 [Tumebacillaceae bacterium]